MHQNTPLKLLLSVRNAAEAAIARAAGVDILDVKEPNAGSLGRASEQTWREIASEHQPSKIPLSLAAGELRDFSPEMNPGVPAGVTFLKLGLAGLRNERNWRLAWQTGRQLFDPESAFQWVAVIYADPASDAPDPQEILEEAAATGCAGVLVDTFSKNGQSLFRHVSVFKCREWRQQANDFGLFFALAGSLKLADLPSVCEVGPQIVAVRSAVCREGERGGMIDASRVTDWVQTLRAAHLSARS